MGGDGSSVSVGSKGLLIGTSESLSGSSGLRIPSGGGLAKSNAPGTVACRGLSEEYTFLRLR